MRSAMLESQIEYAMQKQVGTNVSSSIGVSTIADYHADDFIATASDGISKSSKEAEPEKNAFVAAFNCTVDQTLSCGIDQMIKNETLPPGVFGSESLETYFCLQYKIQLESSDAHIDVLTKEILALKEEIFEVKKRNKQLAFILAQGEMKEKSELLMQVEGVLAEKEALANQVHKLNANLAMEKSKVNQLENELKKSRKK